MVIQLKRGSTDIIYQKFRYCEIYDSTGDLRNMR